MTKKITIVGDADAGKTTLLDCLEQGDSFQFIEGQYSATIGSNMKSKMLEGSMFRIWDTSGAGRHRTFIQQEINDADVIIIAIDLSKADPVNQFLRWRAELGTKAQQVPLILAGTKSDLDIRGENMQALRKYVTEILKLSFNDVIATSAKTKSNVKVLFETAARKTNVESQPIVNEVSTGYVVRDPEVGAVSAGFAQRHKKKLIAAGIITVAIIVTLVLLTIFLPPLIPFVAGLFTMVGLTLPEAGLGVLVAAAFSATVGLLASAIITAGMFVIDAIRSCVCKPKDYQALTSQEMELIEPKPDYELGETDEHSVVGVSTSYKSPLAPPTRNAGYGNPFDPPENGIQASTNPFDPQPRM